MIPFFFLKIRKEENYCIFNSVDNKKYILDYSECRVLELCDGTHTLEEISDMVIREFNKTKEGTLNYVTVLLDKMYRAGMIAWRQEKIDFKKNWPPPSIVVWNITGECNLRCFHCRNFNKKNHINELSTAEIKSSLNEIASYGVEEISFSGGEPFMRNDFLDIVHYTAGLGFKSVSVGTNGTLINRDIAKQLKRANMNVFVSIDGDVAEIHDSMRGIKGAFDQAIHGIKLFQEEGIDPLVLTTATKLNIERIPQIIQLMEELGVKKHSVQCLLPMGFGKKNVEKLRLKSSQIKSLVKYLESENITGTSYYYTLEPPPEQTIDLTWSGACRAAHSYCSITPEGNVVPCNFFWGMNGENLHDHTFGWIWENSKLLNYFRNIQLKDIKGVCRDCKWLGRCRGGCKAENYAYGDIFGSSQSCWVADEMRQNTAQRHECGVKTVYDIG